MSRTLCTLVIAVTIFFLPAFAQENNHTLSWQANWIWQAADGPENTWLCFRKTFDLHTVPAAVTAHIAVDSKYWLYINDSLVVFEGGLNRGPTPTSGYFDSIDIQPYIEEGENCIAVLVWYWGNEGRNNVDSGQGGLVFQADFGDIMLASDDSWKIKVHPAYGYVPFTLNAGNRYYLYGGWNVGFDARLDMPDWYKKHYDDSLWLPAVEKGVPPCAPWNELFARPIPLWKNSGLLDYVNSAELPEVTTGSTIVARLPHNAQVTPYFKIDAPAGLKIKIETDHYDVGGYYGHRAEYITTEGEQEFEFLAWQNGEKVLYQFPAGINILELKYRETGYNTELAGSFECNDSFYNTLFEKAARTLYVCMRDNYMDCPDRERGQWIGDVSTYIPQTFYMLDRQSDALTVKAIDDFINWREDDLLKGLAPGSDLTEFASQSLNAISDVGILLTYYQHTGDLAPILRSYDAVKNYLLVWQLNQDGQIVPRAKWNGQGNNVDHILIENTWYYMALKAAKEMARLSGHGDDISLFQAKMDLMAANFDYNFWYTDVYRSDTFVDDRANGLVVLSGLAGKEKFDNLSAVLRNYKYSGPYMEGYILQALFEMRQPDSALFRMKQRYAAMVNDPNYTTLWEAFWRIGSSNHAWSGAPVTSLFRYVVGIHPVAPGYDSYQILPQLGFLAYASVVVPSVKGNIAVDIQKQQSFYSIDLDSPAATTAIVGLPKDAFGDETVNAIEADGCIVWRRGYVIGDTESIRWAGEDDFYYKFTVDPGQHQLIALRAPLSVHSSSFYGGAGVIESYPNPFNAQTAIKIRVPESGRLVVNVYDVNGKHVCFLLDEDVTAGEMQHIVWDGTIDAGIPAASGLYFFTVELNRQKFSHKLMLVR